ncbi:MAG: LysR family transcriptional regulator [Pseudomonadales bacterium]|jgi:DNA-binding transcriptional LysR family regulator
MDFNQVRYFLALADTLNFTRAADKCFVTQPALTQAIRRLEDELGGQLVHRDGKNTELTKLGKSVRGYFEQIERAKRLVQSSAKAMASDQTAEINIGLMCTVGPLGLMKFLDSFQMENPSVSFTLHDVTPAAIPSLLSSGMLDCVFCARSGPPIPGFRRIELFKEDMVVAFHPDHAFSAMQEVPLPAIAQQRYIDRLHCEFRDKFFELCRDLSLDLKIVCRSQREDWIQSLVLEGIGVSVIPRLSILQPDLEFRPVTQPNLSRTIELIVGESMTSAVLEQLILHTRNYNWPASSSAET